MGKKKAAQLSHAEIWDDSALLQSWDEALAEYQVRFKLLCKHFPLSPNVLQAYHSIQARGEQVDDVLNAAKSSSGAVELGVDLSMQMRKVDSEDQDELEDGELEEVEGGVHQEQSDGNVQNEPANGLGNAPVPQGNQQDILASIINGGTCIHFTYPLAYH